MWIQSHHYNQNPTNYSINRPIGYYQEMYMQGILSATYGSRTTTKT